MVWRTVLREESRLLGGWRLYILSCILFLVPFYLPEGTVPELSGRANAFDYQSDSAWGNVQTDSSGQVGHNQSEHGIFVWSDLDPYAAFILCFWRLKLSY